jgi:rSAM/selenodomain-associated transferase 2
VEIGVVIPALDEAETIGATVRSARAGATHGAGCADRVAAAVESVESVEVVVVDGGSRDGTPQRAQKAGARVIASGPGRARQLQAGLEASRADVVLFLHGDTRLPERWDDDVRRALADPEVVGGAFRLRFDVHTPWLRAVERGADWRARWLGLPYGDQALFFRRAALAEAGGVPQAPIMEDLDLVHAMRRRGRLALLESEVTTSARRYLRGGPVRTWTRNALALAAWGLGLDRARVAAWYRS